MPALDLRRGWRTFRTVEEDAWHVTICADNSNSGCGVGVCIADL